MSSSDSASSPPSQEYVAIGTLLAGTTTSRLLLCKKVDLFSGELQTNILQPGTYDDFMERVRALWSIGQPARNLMLSSASPSSSGYRNSDPLLIAAAAPYYYPPSWRTAMNSSVAISSQSEWEAFWMTNWSRLNYGSHQICARFDVVRTSRLQLPEEYLLPPAPPNAVQQAQDEDEDEEDDGAEQAH